MSYLIKEDISIVISLNIMEKTLPVLFRFGREEKTRTSIA
jgi:hypothetical protein